MTLSFQSAPATKYQGEDPFLTVISANLWHDWPLYRNIFVRLESFAQLVEESSAQILLLQEVSRSSTIEVDRWLAERLGMAYAFSSANGDSRFAKFQEGVAVFSRYPLKDPAVCHLRPKPLQLIRRLAISASVATPFGELLAVSTHLGHGRRLNSGQMAHLRSWVKKIDSGRPTFLGGDFNTHEDVPQIKGLEDRWVDLFRLLYPCRLATTYELDWPWGGRGLHRRLDYLFLNPGSSSWRLISSRHVKAGTIHHSDHMAVVARLTPISAVQTAH